MKLAPTILILLLSSLAICAVTLEWDYPDNERTNIQAFVLHSSTNIALPLTNWPTLITVTNTAATNLTFSMSRQQMFFYLTASNWWGESDPSNVVGTPPSPATGSGLRIYRLP